MKNYTASEELIDILLKNGFTEITKDKRPSHFMKLKEEGYNPDKIKRVFSINGHKKNYIEFDYVMIKARYKEGCSGANMKTEITTDELKSIITFYKLPFQTQNKIKRNGGYIYNISHSYDSIKNHADYYKKDKSALFLIDIFEGIIL